MVRPIQELLLTRWLRFGAGMLAALALVLTLSGCGRKGKLNPPPSASAVQKDAPADQTAEKEQPDFDEEGKPVAPRGEKKSFFLDWLLN